MENKKEEGKKYTIDSIDDSCYRKIFIEITKCGKRFWIKKGKGSKTKVTIIQHPQYSDYWILDFNHLYTFLVSSVISKGKTKIGFEDAIDSSYAPFSSEVFYRGKFRNINPQKVEIGIYVAARFLGIPLIDLLAQFLQDCESKKIRLFLYDEYEDVIKSFLQHAPYLVKQLQPKSPHPFAPNKQEQQLPEQAVAEDRFGAERVQGKEKWLDPYNFDELPLVGREKEFALLNEFIQTDGQFKIWAIAGPSGSGKTRLTSQWAYDSPALKNWDRCVLHKEDRLEPEKWSDWAPDKPTLIIIDYIYGFEAVIQKLMNHRFKSDTPEIRLLLIDHVFSEPLHSDKRWGFSGDGSSLNRNEKYFYSTKLLDLRQTQDQEEIIKSIIAHRAELDEEDNQIDIAHKYLQETQGAYHPLFAALVGDAIRSQKDFTVWNRRELIDYYLSGDDRLPWEHGNDLGRWASHFIAIATARRRMKYEDLINSAKNFSSAPKHFGEVKKICQKVTTNDNESTLNPFEPDILGESFFLKFLQSLTDAPDYQEEFRQIFMAGKEDTQTEDATEFIAFIQRLTRNLLNDDQSQKETQAFWDSLFNFMDPSDFRDAEPIRWAMTVSLVDIANALQEQLSEKEMASLISKIEPAVLYHVNNEDFLDV